MLISTGKFNRILAAILLGVLTMYGGSSGAATSAGVSGGSFGSGARINGKVGSAEYGKFATLATNSTGLCAVGTVINFTTTSKGWTWACQGSNGGSTDSSGSANQTSSTANALAQTVKYSGCTFDGLIGTSNSGLEATGKNSNGTRLTLFNEYIDLISRSNCTYLGRAIDLWDWPPDFTAISANMAAFYDQLKTLSRPAGAPQNYVFGTYMAEHVSLTMPYFFDSENRYLNFSEMCETRPLAGDTDCLASYNQPEYVNYVTDVMTKSIDLGLQVYLFGKVGGTDPKGTVATSNLVKVMNQMRAYAASKGMKVLFIGQNPNVFGGPTYLNSFDLIQGGAYINDDGTIPDTAVVSNKGPGTHAAERLWMATTFRGQPMYILQNLVIEYDWYGNPMDDSSEAACLSISSQSYFNFVKSMSSANCPFGTLIGSAVPATQAIYDNLKSLGVGFWRPGRQRIAFPPYFYSPIDLTLAPGTRQEINFNDEGVLAIGAGQ